jgi:amidophosphoribosyltransferase
MSPADRMSPAPTFAGPVYEPSAIEGRPEIREACGVVGIYGSPDEVVNRTYFALFAVQHRGQESAGIAVARGGDLWLHRDMGLVSHVLTDEVLDGQRGHPAVGHCRYSTTGSSNHENIQPVVLRADGPNGLPALEGVGPIAVAHNGNVVNALELREAYATPEEAVRLGSDTAVLAHSIATAHGDTVLERLHQVMPRWRGSFSLVIATPSQLIGLRDGMGNRPLCIGRLGDGWMLASETCALDSVGATFYRDVEPGEVVVIDAEGLTSAQVVSGSRRATCAFEFIYFQRPDSRVNGLGIHAVRREMGRLLARQRPTDADVVIGVPDSAIAAATGFAEASGLPYADGFVRNRYIGRTFIEPTPRLRKLGARLKYNVLPEVTRGRRVVVLDDSIVRGTTQRQLVGMLRDIGGAAEVHVRITAPPVRWPCFLGIDIPDPDELIASELTIDEIRNRIGADSLEFLTVENLTAALGTDAASLCLGCFTGDYPVDVQLSFDKLVLERPVGLATPMVFPRDEAVGRV